VEYWDQILLHHCRSQSQIQGCQIGGYCLEAYIKDTLTSQKDHNTYNFCVEIYSLLQILYWDKNIIKFEQYYQVMIKMKSEIENDYAAQIIHIHFLTMSLFYQDLLNTDTSEIETSINNLPKNTGELIPDLYLNFYTTLSGIYLNRKMYSECINIHNVYIYPFEYKSQLKVYLIQTKLQEIICYYSLNLLDNLNSAIRSLYRMLLKEKNISQCYQILLRFFKKNQVQISKNAISDLKKEMNTLAKEHPTEKILIQSFNLMAWLD